jgi:hypothetical protein
MMPLVEVGILDRVFYALARASSPEEILSLYSNEEENERLEELTQKNKAGELSITEMFELQQYLLAEKYVRLAKAHAFAKLNNIQF